MTKHRTTKTAQTTKATQEAAPTARKTTSPRAAHVYLDVQCTLVEVPGLAESAAPGAASPTYRVVLHLRDWADADDGGTGGDLSMSREFATEDAAVECVANAIVLFGLRRCPSPSPRGSRGPGVPAERRWRNASSPGLRRAVRRVSGRLRRSDTARGERITDLNILRGTPVVTLLPDQRGRHA
jgi:hypothetical protein